MQKPVQGKENQVHKLIQCPIYPGCPTMFNTKIQAMDHYQVIKATDNCGLSRSRKNMEDHKHTYIHTYTNTHTHTHILTHLHTHVRRPTCTRTSHQTRYKIFPRMSADYGRCIRRRSPNHYSTPCSLPCSQCCFFTATSIY